MTLRKLLMGSILALSLSGCATALGGGLGGWIGHQSDRSPNRVNATIGAAVAVRFAVPRDITVAARGGNGTVPVAQVTTMFGRVLSSSGDTLSLELAEIIGKSGRERYTSQHSANVVRDSSTSVQLLDRHPGRTTGIVLGMAVGFIADVFLLLYSLGY
jgi:hypothetical protein